MVGLEITAILPVGGHPGRNSGIVQAFLRGLLSAEVNSPENPVSLLRVLKLRRML
jgi:hypothetical protein